MNRVGRVLVVVAVVAGVVALGQFLPLAEWAAGAAEAARDTGPLGLVGFGLVYALATVLLLPGSPLTLAAGAAWGPALGMLAVWPGAVLGSVGAWALGRTVLRERAVALIDSDPRWRAVGSAIDRQGSRLVLLLRLSPVFPFNLLNLGLGATGISLWSYLWATALGILPGTLLYVVAGAALGDVSAVAAGRSADTGTGGLVLTVIGLVATAAVTVWITKVARRALSETISEPVEET